MIDMDVQSLIESGNAWHLEGFTGRQCMAAIEAGYAVLGTVGHRDYWGNYVPSRTEVKAGTKGSVLYAHNTAGERDGHAPQAKGCGRCRILRASGRLPKGLFRQRPVTG